MAEVADALGWSTRQAREFLLAEKNATVRHRERYFTTKSRLRRVFKEDAPEILAGLPE